MRNLDFYAAAHLFSSIVLQDIARSAFRDRSESQWFLHRGRPSLL